MKPGDVTFFRYVRHSEVADYESRGWVWAADLGLPHGVFSVLMQWAGEGEPK